MKTILFILSLIATLPAVAHAQLKVVATLPDYAAIAETVGGSKVKVSTIARGTEDPHFVDARPSFIRLLNQADVLIEGGAELEVGWLPALVSGARNPKIVNDAPGHLSLARRIRMIDVPQGPVDRSMGDIHAAGNSHFSLDPANGRIIAASVAETLSRVDPANARFYETNRDAFIRRLDARIEEWEKTLAPYRGTRVLTYHKSFDYLLARFGFELAGTIEPKPGIEPSPTHINGLVPKARENGVKLVIAEPYRPKKTAEYVAQAVGAKFLALPGSVGGNEKVRDYISLFDYNVSQIAAALKK